MIDRFRIWFMLTCVSLAGCCGCATSPKRQAWVAGIRERGVDEAVLQKIELWTRTEVSEIEQLGEKGVPKEDILRHLRESKGVYHLTTRDIDRLRAAKVDREVIDYMLSTPKLRRERERRARVRSPFNDPFCPPYLRHPWYNY